MGLPFTLEPRTNSWSTSSLLHPNPDHGVVLSLSTLNHALHDGSSAAVTHRPGTETKAAVKTTEFVVYLVAVAGVLIASFLVGDADGRGDVFLGIWPIFRDRAGPGVSPDGVTASW